MKGILVGLAVLMAGPLFGVETVDEGPIHEAFIQQIDGGIILSAVPKAPPKKEVMETPSSQKDPQSEWIPGYWSWDSEDESFIWMSGVWRRPPPNHEWIAGYWKKYGQGWVWIPGFWSATAEEDLEYIGDPPPDEIQEEPDNPMGSNFWMPGFWSYDDSQRDYSWVKGQWVALDPDWVLVPAHYTWRPEGYVFIPAYWDWPIEQRGTAYSPVIAGGGESYTPDAALDSSTIVRRLVVYYPNYLCFYHHHYHFHYNFWIGWWGTPPWWGWHIWWGFGWSSQWGLWWWFTHPGFPHPFWLTGAIAAQIWPPAAALLNLMQGLWGWPFIITPNGIVPVSLLRGAIGKKGLPILPANGKKRKNILDKVTPDREEEPLRPSGKPSNGRDRRGSRGPRPDFGPFPDVSTLPPVAPPTLPGRQPPIQPETAQPQDRVQPVPAKPRVPQPAPYVPPRQYPPQQRQPDYYPPQRPVRPRPYPSPRPDQRPRPRPRPRPEQYPSRPHPTRPSPSRPGPSEITPSQTAPRQTAPRQTGPYRQIQPRQVQPRQTRPTQIQPQRSQPQPRQTGPGGYY